MRQPEPEARELALISELLTEGSMDVFAHKTNVQTDNRIVTLDLYEMGEQLRPPALVVALEAVQNRVVENRKKGKFTSKLRDLRGESVGTGLSEKFIFSLFFMIEYEETETQREQEGFDVSDSGRGRRQKHPASAESGSGIRALHRLYGKRR
ncbi:MAG: hypothetical protein IJ112_08855 [Oscillospiraceae bacterium]|nr:hypothetical protein [Oscillospiraceae bacterium]